MDIKLKIEKLLRKAESANELGSLSEAEAFMAKANEMMAKHNIELAELKTEESGNTCIVEKVPVGDLHNWSKTQSTWIQKMYSVVAKFTFCDIVWHDGWDYRKYYTQDDPKRATAYVKPSVTLVGEPHNIEMVKYMCSFLIPVVKRLQSKRWKEVQHISREKKNAFMRGYYLGAVQGIASKLRFQQAENEKTYEGLPGLIKVNEVALQEKKVEAFPNLTKVRSSRLSGVNAAALGREDGKNININKGVSEGSSSISSRLLK